MQKEIKSQDSHLDKSKEHRSGPPQLRMFVTYLLSVHPGDKPGLSGGTENRGKHMVQKSELRKLQRVRVRMEFR